MNDEHDRKKIIEAFFDGEATPEEAEKAQELLDSCEFSQQFFAELTEIRSALKAPIENEVARADFGALWKNIEAELNQEEVRRAPVLEEEQQGTFWSRLAGMFSGQPLIPVGAMALLVMVVVIGADKDIPAGQDGVSPGKVVAEVDTKAASPLRDIAPSPEDQIHLAYVSGVEYESGTVILDQDPDDPSQPLIVWHIEGEGEEASQGG